MLLVGVSGSPGEDSYLVLNKLRPGLREQGQGNSLLIKTSGCEAASAEIISKGSHLGKLCFSRLILQVQLKYC